MCSKDKEKKLSQPHARTFEYFLKEKETAASMLKEYLPEKILNKLDFRTLKISNDSFLDKRLKDYFSDLLYEIKLKSNYKAALIYILFEHKSREEWFICLQLLKYLEDVVPGDLFDTPLNPCGGNSKSQIPNSRQFGALRASLKRLRRYHLHL